MNQEDKYMTRHLGLLLASLIGIMLLLVLLANILG